MTRSIIVAAATALSFLACSDNPNPTAPMQGDPSNPIQPAPAVATLSGRIIVTGDAGDRAVNLKTATGELVRLAGAEAVRLASVDGADAIIRGTWDANPGLVVQDFEVTGMYGRPALDGILELTINGYALRMANGTIRLVTGLPGSIAELVGARLWVVGSEDEPPVEYGVIPAV